MADLQSTIDLIFSGIDRVSPEIDSIKGEIAGFDSAIQGVAAPLSDIANNVLALDAALLGVAATLGGIAYAETIKFESATLDLAKQLTETDKPLEDIIKGVQDLALAYGENSVELIQATANFKQAGFTAEESGQLVKNALDLVIAGGVDADTATGILISTLKGFGVEASEAATLLDVLNETSNNYAASVSQLGEGFAIISPIAKQLNLSFEQTAALLTPVIEVFQSGSEAANGLKSGLLLLTDVDRVNKTFEDLGVSVSFASNQFDSQIDLLNAVASEYGNLDEAQQLAFLRQAIGLEQAPKMAIALEAIANGALESAEGYFRLGSVQDEVNVRLQSAEVVINRTAESFRQLAIAAGTQYKSELTGVIEGTGALARAFSDVVDSGGLDALFDLLRPQLDELAQLFQQVAENLPEAFEQVDFSGLADAFGDLADEVDVLFGALFGDIDLSTVEGLSEVLQSVIDGFETLVRVTQGIAASFQPVFEAIRETVIQFTALDEESKVDFGELIGSMKVLIDLGTALGGALILVGKTGLDMQDTLELAFGAAKVVVNTLQVAFDSFALGVVKVNNAVLETRRVFNAVTGDLEEFDRINQQIAENQELIVAIEENRNRNMEELAQGIDQTTGSNLALNTQLEAQRAKLDEAARKLETFGDKAIGAADATTKTTASIKDLGDQIDVTQFAPQELFELQTQLLEVNKFLDTTTGAITDLGGASEQADQGLSTLPPALERIIDGSQRAEEAARGYKIEIIDGVKTYTQVGSALDEVTESTDKTSAAMKKAEEESESFRLKMEEIASNERLKSLEFAVNLKVAEFEADARRIEALTENLNTIFESTGDVLGEAFGILGKFADEEGVLFGPAGEAFDLAKQQIELENEIRQQAAEDAHALAQAELLLLEQKRRRLASGDSLINISMDGVEPDLEMIMWRIIEKVQMRVNAEAADFLLGAA